MFGRKAKELQELLSKSAAENESMRQRVSELEAEVNRLKDQEASVLRAILEANRVADNIERQAGEKHDQLISEAEQHILDANTKAQSVISHADEEAANLRKEADDYSENIRTDANIFVERTIMASQMEVIKRKDVAANMNDMLRKTIEYLNEQSEKFAAMLSSVIDDSEAQTKSICAEVDKCNCSCKDCKEPCHSSDEADGADEQASDATPAENDEIDPSVLPDDYSDPADLMKNIYLIQKRDIPSTVKPDSQSSDSPDKLPVDDNLGELVSEIVSA